MHGAKIPVPPSGSCSMVGPASQIRGTINENYRRRFCSDGPFRHFRYQGVRRPSEPCMPILVKICSPLPVSLGPICPPLHRIFSRRGLSRASVCLHISGSISHIMEFMITIWHLMSSFWLAIYCPQIRGVLTVSESCNPRTTRDDARIPDHHVCCCSLYGWRSP